MKLPYIGLGGAFTIVGSICIVSLILAGATVTFYLRERPFSFVLAVLVDAAWIALLGYLFWRILMDGHEPHKETLQAPRKNTRNPYHFQQEIQMESRFNTGFGRLVNACFGTFVFLASSALVSLLYTFIVAPGLANERPPGTLQAFLPAWFVLYELGMIAIVIYMWRQETSCDPREREALGIFESISLPGLPVLFWYARDDIPGVLLGLFLVGMMIAAICLATRIREKVILWNRSDRAGLSA